jgi:hypothetical protein
MNLARPHGLVFDSTLGPELLENAVLQSLSTDTVFIRGISEEVPVTIYYTEGVIIPDSVKRPLVEVDWKTDDIIYTFEQIKGQMPLPTFGIDEPANPNDIQVKVRADNPRQAGRTLEWDYANFIYELDGGRHIVKVIPAEIPELIAKWGIRLNKTPITIRVIYPTR